MELEEFLQKNKSTISNVVWICILSGGVVYQATKDELKDKRNYVELSPPPIEIEEVISEEITKNEFLLLTAPEKELNLILNNPPIEGKYEYIDSSGVETSINKIIEDYTRTFPKEEHVITVNGYPAISQDIWNLLRNKQRFKKEIVDLDNASVIDNQDKEEDKEIVQELVIQKDKQDKPTYGEKTLYVMHHKEFGEIKVKPNLNMYLVEDMVLDLEVPFVERNGTLFYPLINLHRVFGLDRMVSQDSVVFSEKYTEDLENTGNQPKILGEAKYLEDNRYELLSFNELVDENISIGGYLRTLVGENKSNYRLPEEILAHYLTNGEAPYKDWVDNYKKKTKVSVGKSTTLELSGCLELIDLKDESSEMKVRLIVDTDENYYVVNNNKVLVEDGHKIDKNFEVKEIILINPEKEYAIKLPIKNNEIEFLESGEENE